MFLDETSHTNTEKEFNKVGENNNNKREIKEIVIILPFNLQWEQ